MAESEWSERVLKVIREKEWKDGKGFGCWIVQKIRDGKSYDVTVRAGMYRPDKVSGGKVIPKDGLTLGDLKSLKAEWKEIEIMLQIPRGEPIDPRTLETQQEPPQEEQIEQMPWGK